MVKHFDQFDFEPMMHKVINQLAFTKPTEIQEKVIPTIIEGQSVIGQSYTGSGKTHAYLLPLFNKLDPSIQEVQFVITVPTRELATQIYEEVKKIIEYADKVDEWKARLLIGGTDKQKMDDKLKKPPHIVVGTPGRILDHVKDNTLSIYSNKSIQLLVFSATIPKKLQHFFKKYLRNPLYVSIDGHIAPKTMEHRLIHTKYRDEATVIVELSKVIQPYLAIIFTNGKDKADE